MTGSQVDPHPAWPYRGMDEVVLAHIENCLRDTVEDADLAIDVVFDLAAAGFMIVPIATVPPAYSELTRGRNP